MLAAREQLLLSIILYYRERGWGYYRIGRVLWPWLNPRTAQMRVIRILRRYCGSNGESMDTCKNFVASTRRLFEEGEDGSEGPLLTYEGPVRLGRTQRLVIAALRSLGGRARFSSIVVEVMRQLSIGDREVVKKRVWAALQRLKARGIVDSRNGVYWITRRIGRVPVLVENFRVENGLRMVVQVWSKRRFGRSAFLDDALDLALLRGARRTVQVELSVRLSDRLAEFMGRHGISIIKIYRDRSPPWHGSVKLEAAFDRPPELYPHPAERDSWVKVLEDLFFLLARSY